jgi:carboxylesterase
MIVNPQLEGDSFLWEGAGANARLGLLLSHGFTATTAEVRPLAQRLRAAGYTVAGPLLPGHKTTPDDLNARHWQDWVGAIDDTYSQLKRTCDRIIVGGESLGGLLALYHASQHPEVAAILTYAPAIQVSAVTLFGVKALSPFVKEFTPKAGPRTLVDEYWQGYAVRPTQAVLQLYAFMDEVQKILPKIKSPLLIVQGRLDTTIDPQGAVRLYEQAGSKVKELHWFEKSTHCIILDQELPEVSALTLNFIAKVAEADTM